MKSLTSKLLCAFLFAIAVAALGYGWLAYDYWSNPSRLTRNYAAELNEPILKIPPNQRAWSTYRDVILELAEGRQEPALRDFREVLHNRNAAEWVRSRRDTLRKARHAAQLPSLVISLPMGNRPKIDWFRFATNRSLACTLQNRAEPSQVAKTRS